MKGVTRPGDACDVEISRGRLFPRRTCWKRPCCSCRLGSPASRSRPACWQWATGKSGRKQERVIRGERARRHRNITVSVSLQIKMQLHLTFQLIFKRFSLRFNSRYSLTFASNSFETGVRHFSKKPPLALLLGARRDDQYRSLICSVNMK